MYDALAMAMILAPTCFTEVQTHVAIETRGELTAGASLIDLKGYLGKEPNASVAVDVDSKRFESWFVEAIGKTANF